MTHTHDAREANLLGALSLAVVDRLARAAEDAAGHRGAAPAALASLATYLDGCSIDVLRRPLGLSHSAAVRLTDRLEAAGFLERAAGADARSVSVRLTRRGADTGTRILEERTAALEVVLAPLAHSERSDLARLHEKLLAGITSGRGDAGRICRLCDPHACGHFEGRCPVTAAADAAERSPR
jgi:DNA-binding MarR family transcriptional regulator